MAVTLFSTLNLAPTHRGAFGLASGPSQSTGAIYMYPITWAGSWSGAFGQPPGLDRVVFNENGTYLGVVTRRWDFRPAAASLDGPLFPMTYRYVITSLLIFLFTSM